MKTHGSGRHLYAEVHRIIFGISKFFLNTLVTFYVAGILLANRIWRVKPLEERLKRRPPLNPNRKLKVGILSEYYYPHLGGLSGDVHYAAIEFAQMGYDVKLITSNVWGTMNPTFNSHGFEILRLGWAIPVFSNGSMAKITMGWRLGRQVKKLLERENFDVIHIHCPWTLTLPLLFQKHANCYLVGHLHTLLEKKPFWYSLYPGMFKKLVHHFDGLVAVSKVCARQFEEWFDCKFEVIPNGVPVAEYKTPGPVLERFNDGKINLFFIGRMEFRNGISILLKAFDLVYERNPNTRLILAGGGPLKKYFEGLVTERTRDAVHFVGPILEEKPAYFRTAHIQICPTWPVAASLGIILLESMSSLRPTVCSNIPAFRETASPEKDVLMADPYKPEEFARQIQRLIDDPELGQQLAKAALQKMERAYDWSSIIARVDAYTQSLMGTESPRARLTVIAGSKG